MIYLRKAFLFFFCNFIFASIVVSQNNADTNFVINKIILSGNKVTRSQVIMREIMFKQNDTVSENQLKKLLEKTRENLMNTSLFNFVTITTDTLPNRRIDVTVDLIERWYIWPLPFFELKERNFNTWWQEKDFSKADYGLYVAWENFRGRKETLKLMLRFGYNNTFGMSYKIPYINKAKTLGMGMSAGIAGNHEVPYLTKNSKQLFYKDENKFVQEDIFGTFNLTLRKGYYVSHTFQLNYDNYSFSDTLLKLNPYFASQKNLEYFTFYYQYKCDHRDFKAYPLKGYYFDVELSKTGFGILKNEKINLSSIHTSVRKYWNLSKRWYYACGINAKVSTLDYQPYFWERALGYGNDYVRSYEYYVIDGQAFGVLKSNVKFELVPTKVKTFNFIPAKKFNKLFYAVYLNGILDMGYVYDWRKAPLASISNQPLIGGGFGIDFVTYYDKVFRVEWTVNKMGENGIFLNFVSPI